MTAGLTTLPGLYTCCCPVVAERAHHSILSVSYDGVLWIAITVKSVCASHSAVMSTFRIQCRLV